MRVVRLQAENLMRIKAIDITPEGNLVVVGGRNGAGKSSLLNSIFWTLIGPKAMKGVKRPVRDGEDRATVTVDLGDYKVTRSWTEDGGHTVKVENADGFRAQSPQALLDGFLGMLSFDPLDFTRQAPKAQLATLLELVDLPFDPETLASERATIFEQRTIANREANTLEAQIAGMPAPPDDLPAEPVSVAELGDSLRQVTENIAWNERVDRDVERAGVAVAAAEADVSRLVTALAEARSAVTVRRSVEKDMLRAKAKRPPMDDLVAQRDRVAAQLAEVDELNESIRDAQERAKLIDRRTLFVATSEDQTNQIEAIDERKSEAMKQAKMPIDGLGFDDDGVTYKGVPFSQCSSAEQLRVSISMAMAVNPDIRVIRVTDGSLLDDDSLALLGEMAAENDYQVFLERVGDGAEVSIVIEDGLLYDARVPKGADDDGR